MEETYSDDDLQPLRTILVTELNYSVTESLLYKTFSKIGPILSLRINKDPIHQKCNGDAHITYYRSQDAHQAFQCLNNTLMLGNPMMLYWAEEDVEKTKYHVESILVGNLNIDIDDEDVEALFEPYGKILYCSVNRDSDGNSLSTAYVHYKYECRFMELMTFLNGTNVGNQRIQIVYIQATDDIPFTNIYIKYLSSDMDNIDLHNMFIRFGAINSCVVMKYPDGTSKGFGFVNFKEAKAAKRAVEDMHLSCNSQQETIHVLRADRKPIIPSSLRHYEEKMGKPLLTYLFVDNIGIDTTDFQVRCEFEPFQNLKGVKCIKHKKKCYAYIVYKESKAAKQAVRLMAEQMNFFNSTNISVINRFEYPSFSNQTCAIPVIAHGIYSPIGELPWKVFWQINIKPKCEPGKKWKIHQLCRAEIN